MSEDCLSDVVGITEQISGKHGVGISVISEPHGNFITITLNNGSSMTFDYDLEVKITEDLGLNPTTTEFINDLINQTIDNS